MKIKPLLKIGFIGVILAALWLFIICAGLAVLALTTGCMSVTRWMADRIDERKPDAGSVVVAPGAPAVVPEPVAPVADSGFRWEPGPDSVRVVIPASLAHWQLTVVTLATHHTLYGPDHSGKGKGGDVEYTLPGSGADWAAKAAATCPRRFPSIMVYVNTHDMQATGHRSAGWRILDPSKPVIGDEGTRLQPGQNK
jgi:hypothetical protein